MSKNRRGGLTGNLEWGKQARKQEDAERNLNGRARREAITEGLVELGPLLCGHRWYWSDSRNLFVCVFCGELDEA